MAAIFGAVAKRAVTSSENLRKRPGSTYEKHGGNLEGKAAA